MRASSRTCVLGVASIVAAMGCQTPTSMTIEISAEADCDGSSDFEIAIGRPGEVDPGAPASSKECDARGAKGSVVALPGDDENIEIAMQVALGVGVPTASCTEGAPSCIVARRRLRFLPGSALVLDVPLTEACLGVACDPDDTCSDGVCVSATIDSAACDGGRCQVGDLGGGSAAAATSASSSGSSDASSSTSSTSSGEGGAGGSGSVSSSGAGGEGGAGTGGEGGAGTGGSGTGGGGPLCGALETSRIALGPDFSCVVSGAEDLERVLCRGTGATQAFGWVPVMAGALENPELHCVEHIEVDGDVLCARVHEGQGCPPQAGVYCSLPDQGPLNVGFVGAGHVVMAVGATEHCSFAPSGSNACSAAGLPPLDAAQPLVGADGGGTGFCVWGAAGPPICWGNASLLDVPDLGGCVTDLEVAAGYACAAVGREVTCWGVVPAQVGFSTSLAADVVDLAVGDAHVCAQLATQEVMCWGSNAAGQIGEPRYVASPIAPRWAGGGPTAFHGIAAGASHSAVIGRTDASNYALGWGLNASRQVADCAPINVMGPLAMGFPSGL